MIPEMHEGKSYRGQDHDLFSLAVLLFSMRAGYLPFQEAHPKNYWYELIVNENFKQFWEDHEADKNGHFTSELKDLLNQMLSYDP